MKNDHGAAFLAGQGRLAVTIKKTARQNGHTHEAPPGAVIRRPGHARKDAMYHGGNQIHCSSVKEL